MAFDFIKPLLDQQKSISRYRQRTCIAGHAGREVLVDGKGYLTVIDFIGNYENNYLIPIALYGDTSYNKDSLRKLITEGSRMIPGASTINFDEITKERIFQSIDSANMQLFSDLKKDYNLLKFKLGRIPMMMDFVNNEAREPFS